MDAQTVSPELIASGTLLAAAIIFSIRMAFRFWSQDRRFLALVFGLPAGLYGSALLISAFGFGTF